MQNLSDTLFSSRDMRLNPWYVSGFIDGEGCFTLIINSERKRRCSKISIYKYWVVDFSIHLRSDDKDILYAIQKFYNAGRISIVGKEPKLFTHYNIRNRTDIITKLIPHLDSYPLQAKKKKDYLLWKEAVLLLEKARSRKNNLFSGQCLTKDEENRLYELKDRLAERLTGIKREDYFTRRNKFLVGKTIE